MNNRYVLILDIVDHNLADICLLQPVPVPQEEEIAALEGRLHATAEDDNYGRGGVRDDRKTFPHLRKVSSQSQARKQHIQPAEREAYHECCGQHQAKVEDLGGCLPRVP